MPKNCLTQINFWKGIASQRWNIHLLICSDLFQFIILMLTSAPHLASACIQSQQRPASPCSRCKRFSERISTADIMEGTGSYQTTAAAWCYSNQCLWANCFMLGNTFQEMAQPCSPLSSLDHNSHLTYCAQESCARVDSTFWAHSCRAASSHCEVLQLVPSRAHVHLHTAFGESIISSIKEILLHFPA